MATAQRVPYRVLSFAKWCEAAGFSTRTGRRIVERGEGPKITKLSDQRIGVREDHAHEWLEGRIVRRGKAVA
jgi:predicted DNA-binding transcriptional regulator AlpA